MLPTLFTFHSQTTVLNENEKGSDVGHLNGGKEQEENGLFVLKAYWKVLFTFKKGCSMMKTF